MRIGVKGVQPNKTSNKAMICPAEFRVSCKNYFHFTSQSRNSKKFSSMNTIFVPQREKYFFPNNRDFQHHFIHPFQIIL